MENTKEYSGLFIIAPEKLDQLDEVKQSIGSSIGEKSGAIVTENVIGKKALAYPVKKRNEGVYYEVIFKAVPTDVPRMMNRFRINTDILRAIVDARE